MVGCLHKAGGIHWDNIASPSGSRIPNDSQQKAADYQENGFALHETTNVLPSQVDRVLVILYHIPNINQREPI